MQDIKKLEKETINSRKSLIFEKMQEYYAFYGNSETDIFLDWLKENTTFKYGMVLDFETFKNDFLTDFDKLQDFSCFYCDNAYSVDELLYCGFDGDLKLTDENNYYFVFYEALKDYDFDLKVLNAFEEFVNEMFLKCC